MSVSEEMVAAARKELEDVFAVHPNNQKIARRMLEAAEAVRPSVPAEAFVRELAWLWRRGDAVALSNAERMELEALSVMDGPTKMGESVERVERSVVLKLRQMYAALPPSDDEEGERQQVAFDLMTWISQRLGLTDTTLRRDMLERFTIELRIAAQSAVPRV